MVINGQLNVNEGISLSMNQLIVTIHYLIERINFRYILFSDKDRLLHLILFVQDLD